MAFSRVKPGGWAANEKLTSAQQNQLDIDHANAVDKTGDTITGNVHVGNAARITVDAGGKIVNANGGIIECQNGSNTNFLTGATATWNANSFLTVTGGGIATVNNSALTVSGTSVFAVGGSVTTTFNGVVTFVSGSELVVNDVASFNGLTTFYDNTTIDNAALFLTSGSVIGVHGGAGISWANTANATFQSGSTATFQNGATLSFSAGSSNVHALASTETYQNGALLTQASGSIWTMGGVTNLASGGALNLQSGSAVTFTSVPTLGNGFTASAGTSSIAGTLNVSATANFSGTTTVTGSSNRLKLTSRSVTKRLVLSRALVIAAGSPVSFNYDTANDTVEIGSGSTIILDLDIPNNAVVTEIEYTWTGIGNTQAAFRANAAVVTGIASHSSPGTYTISATETILRATTSYRFTFTETASNVPKLTSVFVTYTVTEYSEG